MLRALKTASCALIILALGLTAAPGVVRAVPFDNRPKILLHLQPVTQKNVCDSGALANCADAVTSGQTAGGPGGPFYFAYLLVARGNVASIAGLELGIDYQDNSPGNVGDQNRIDIFQWGLCATLEFIAPGLHTWPQPRGGNLITWDWLNQCQTGETAVAGYFYLACYGSADTLSLTPRPVSGLASVADCSAIETRLTPADLGQAIFTDPGFTPGCSPCNEPCPGLPDTEPPSALTRLEVTSTGLTKVNLRWYAPGDDGAFGYATAYDMRYSTTPIDEAGFSGATPATGEPTPAAPGTAQAMTVSNLTSTTTYYFAIKTVDDAGNWSGLSNVVFGTTLTPAPTDTIPPAAVSDLRVVGTASYSLTLAWTAPGDDGNVGRATGYDLRYMRSPIDAENFGQATPAVGEPVPATAGTGQSFVVTGLQAHTTWYFAIRAQDETPNWSPVSNTASDTTLTLPPGANSGARLLLHVNSVTTKNPCPRTLTDCRNAVVSGGLYPQLHYVYLMAGRFRELADLRCGITYDQGRVDGMSNHERLDIYAWSLCATGEFPSGAPNAWPQPGSGNRIVWDSANACQSSAVAVAGYFYVGAYSSDRLRILPYPGEPTVRVFDCLNQESDIPAAALGYAGFGSGTVGFNPCEEPPPMPVRNTTWSGIKTLLGP